MNPMSFDSTRRKFLGLLAIALAGAAVPARAQENRQQEPRPDKSVGGRKRMPENCELPVDLAAFGLLSLVLGRVTRESVTVSALAKDNMEGYFEYGAEGGAAMHKTGMIPFPAGKPVETSFDNLHPDTEYSYRLHVRHPGEQDFRVRPECRFHTQRAAGSTFTFGVQGDSHPERPQMNDPKLFDGASAKLCRGCLHPGLGNLRLQKRRFSGQLWAHACLRIGRKHKNRVRSILAAIG